MEGPPDQPVSRVVCIHPDGRVTEFANRLHCVFGLLYFDGKLYVNHAPKFSVFADGGDTGSEREDWFDYTSPRNGGILMTGSRTHIPAGIRLGMDGRIYMAVGDIGIYGTLDRSGRRVDMRGGGVLRFQPDGKEMEIVSLGTRNHPELAMNDEDEIFTYDNTDDGPGWWTRVTHMVDGGFYGYPWDYIPQQPYTLWMMTDFGPGSGTSALSYTEDALPDEYHGAVFFGDYARSEVLRLRLERSGATYRVAERVQVGGKDFLSRGGGEFRPISMTVTPDGMGFYLTDWRSMQVNTPGSVGRLLKITHTGQSRARPKPAWFIPAAQARPHSASLEELLEGLQHPAQSVRLVAQHQLKIRGASAIPGLTALVRDAKAPAAARWGALWALNSIKDSATVPEVVAAALIDPDPGLRRQAARAAGMRSDASCMPALINAAADADPTVRLQAAIALGRIGDVSAVPALMEQLTESDTFARYAAFHALNEIGKRKPAAWDTIVPGLASGNARIAEGTRFALRETWSEELLVALDVWLRSTPPPPEQARRTALDLAAAVARREPEWNGIWWGYDLGVHPATHPRPKRTQEWPGTQRALAILRAGLSDGDRENRITSARHLAKLRDPLSSARMKELWDQAPPDDSVLWAELLLENGGAEAPQIILRIIRNGPDALRAVALKHTGAIPNPEIGTALRDYAAGSPPPALLGLALGSLAAHPEALPEPLLLSALAHPDPLVAQQAVKGLATLGTPEAINALGRTLLSNSTPVALAAISALEGAPSADAAPHLAAALSRPELFETALKALCARPTKAALEGYIRGIESGRPDLQQASVVALSAIQDQVLPQLDSLAARGKLTPLFERLWESIRRQMPVEQFYVLGPFGGRIPDASVALKPNLRATIPDDAGRPVAWRQVKAARFSGTIRLSDYASPGARQQQSLYLVTSLDLSRPERIELALSTDRPLSVWINSRRIHSENDPAPRQPLTLDLPAGQTVLALRQSRAEQVYHFAAVLRAPGGGPPATVGETAEYEGFARNNSGNIARGKQLFFEQTRTGCARCHRSGGSGGIGPSLDGVGIKYSRQQLIEAVLYPSRQILNGYQTVRLTLRDGETVEGLVRSEDDSSITMVTATGHDVPVKRSVVASRQVSDLSLMPDGLHQGLTTQEFADLITYLESLGR